MKKTNLFGMTALAVFGLLLSMSLASAYRGDYSIPGPEHSEERHELMETAFESLDYAGWYWIMTENGRMPRVVLVVTEDNFDRFVAAWHAGKSGDIEAALDIRAELGLGSGQGASAKFGEQALISKQVRGRR